MTEIRREKNTPPDKLILEACVETADQALAAERNGADRLELCTDLAQDGLTPSIDLVAEVTELVEIPVKVMLRPRAGNFVYSDSDFEDTKRELEHLLLLPISGIVYGALNDQGYLNIDLISQIARMARPYPITVHKAIDLCVDPIRSSLELVDIPGVTSILTSGGASTALEGADVINQMVMNCSTKLTIIAAGKITDVNIGHVSSVINATEFHGKRIVGEI